MTNDNVNFDPLVFAFFFFFWVLNDEFNLNFFFCFRYFYRAAKDLEERRSHYEPSIGPGVADENDHFKLEENDFVPHFQRVSISGEDTSGVSWYIIFLLKQKKKN